MTDRIKWLFVIFFVASAAIIGVIFGRQYLKSSSIDSYDECVEAGYTVIEGTHDQCMVNGKTYTEHIN